MLKRPNYHVRVIETADGDFCWSVIERSGLFRRRTVARSELQFLTWEGAHQEGHKALHAMILPVYTRAPAPVRTQELRQLRHLRLVFSRDGV